MEILFVRTGREVDLIKVFFNDGLLTLETISLSRNSRRKLWRIIEITVCNERFQSGSSQIIKRKSENHCHFYRHNFVDDILYTLPYATTNFYMFEVYWKRDISVDQILFIITDKTHIFDESNISKLTMGLHSFPLSNSVQHFHVYNAIQWAFLYIRI